MGAKEVVASFWSAMKDNDWPRAAGHLAEDCAVDWPCSGERIVGRTLPSQVLRAGPRTRKTPA